MSDIQLMFQDHLRQCMASASRALDALGYRSLILGSGAPYQYFEDDMDATFKPNPHFARWCPAKGAHHFLKFTPAAGSVPLLVLYAPEDYWHDHPEPVSPLWENCFEIVRVASADKLWSALGDTSQSVFVGNEIKYAVAAGVKVNCELLTARLNWHRRYKTDYEIFCLSQANQLAAKGHLAARDAFFAGASEYEIHMAYLMATGLTDGDLPYTGIVALDQNAAILHYHGRKHQREGRVLLLDSGASFENYSSDITRTYLKKEGGDEVFEELLAGAEALQQRLCEQVRAGVYYPDIHRRCHLEVAELLEKTKIIQVGGDYDLAVKEGITRVFLPHGLGHMLGVQVHDIGGKQLDENGNPVPLKEGGALYRSLRFIGELAENMVVTVEPGIYFIPILLNEFRKTHPVASAVNWDLVERLLPLGGIRIEDDVLVTADSPRNLTREYLPT